MIQVADSPPFHNVAVKNIREGIEQCSTSLDVPD